MKKTRLLWILLFPVFLWGCTRDTVPAPTTEATVPAITETTAQTLDASDEAQALAALPEPAVPVIPEAVASGDAETRCDSAVIDHSHLEDGYVMVRCTDETDKRLKVLVKGPTTTYSYNLPREQWTVFPISDGSGNYQIGIYKNVTGSKYSTLLTANVTAQLRDEFAPFLRPNQYVDYAEAHQTVSLGLELTAGLDEPLDKVTAVYDYVVSSFTYDHDKAATVQSGYLPVLDQVLAEKKGICFDYAAVMTAMLRSQEIPCKLVVGYAGSAYHAWISVWTEHSGWVDGAIFFDGNVWHRMDPTFASSGERSDEIMDFIENGSYTVKYLY